MCGYTSISYAFYTTQSWGASAGGVHLQVCTPFLYLRNDWTDCAEIWHALRDQTGQFTQITDGVSLHVRTCLPLFRISQTPGQIALKFGILLDAMVYG